MSMRVIAAAAAIVCTCPSSAFANAKATPTPTRIGIAPLTFEGEGASQIDAQLTDALVRHDTEVVRLDARCGDTRCRAEQASSKALTHIVELDVGGDLNDYRMELTLYDATGARVHGVGFACEICSPEDAAAAVAGKAAELRPVLGLASDPTSDPEPPREPERTFAPSDSIDPPRTQAIDDGSAGRARVFRIAGWTTAGVGLGAVVAGAVLIAIDSRPYKGDCTGESLDVNGKCEFLYDTVAGGGTLVAIGSAALVTGIALAVIGHTRARRDTRRVRAGIGPGIHLGVAF